MSGPSEEQSELLGAVVRWHVSKQGRGRPKKDSTAVTWEQLGFTRQQVHTYRKLASIPEATMEAYFDQCLADGRMPTYRGLYSVGGLENVASENVFGDTVFGELAEKVLKPVERIAEQMNDRQRRCFMRALRERLKGIACLAELTSDETKNGKCSNSSNLPSNGRKPAHRKPYSAQLDIG